jgi:repressor of nif and glnA expression
VETEAQEGKNERIRKERMELPLDQRLGRAVSHPLRATLLAKLNTNPAAASDLEQEFKEAGAPVPLSNISYHVRELWRWGLIEVVSTEPVRGATKTVYRGITKMQLSDDAFKAMSAESQDGIVIEAVKEVYDRIKAAIEGGTFAKNDNSHIITAIPSVDKRGFDEIAAVIAETFGRVTEIAAEAVNRETDPAKRFRATVSLLSYESPAGK